MTGSPYALWVGGKCTLKGPGCIIAVGDVYFEPNPDVGGEGEPVFVFSVLGRTTIRPGINMYGAIAGSFLERIPFTAVAFGLFAIIFALAAYREMSAKS